MHRSSMNNKHVALAAAIAACAASATSALAGTVIWDGGAGTNRLWTDPLNWDTNTLPVTGDTVVIPKRVPTYDHTFLGDNGSMFFNAGRPSLASVVFGTDDTATTDFPATYILWNNDGAPNTASTMSLTGDADTNLINLKQGVTGTIRIGRANFGTLSITLGNGNLNVTNSTATLRLDPVISGTNGLTKTGDGKVLLNASDNTYTGGTTINGGTLEIISAVSLGSGASANNVTINNGTLRAAGGSPDLGTNRGIILGHANSTVDVDATRSMNFGGVVSGTGKLNKIGAGVLGLSNGTNSFSGGLNILAGGVQINTGGSLGGSSNTITIGDAYLTMSAGSGAATSILSGRGFVLDDDNSRINIVSNANASTWTINGVISGNGTLNKLGTGVLLLATSTNTFSGGIVIGDGTNAGGTLQAGSNARLGNANNPITINNGTFSASASYTVGSGHAITLGHATSAISADAAGTTLTVPAIGGTGTLNKTGLGTLVLSAANTYEGGTVVAAGTLSLGAAGSIDGDITVASGATLTGTGTINFDITDDTTDTFTSAGAVNLDGLTLDLNFTGTQTPSTPYTILSGSYSGEFADVLDLGDYQITYGVDSVSIMVPEPASLATVGLVGLLALRRRRSA